MYIQIHKHRLQPHWHQHSCEKIIGKWKRLYYSSKCFKDESTNAHRKLNIIKLITNSMEPYELDAHAERKGQVFTEEHHEPHSRSCACQ